jgi:PPOX class probable F420-dependent enzyme
MSQYPDSHLDLLTQPGIAIFSTNTPGGDIQSTALWYLLDDGALKISISGARKKFRNLQQNPNANFFILDPANPFRFIEVRGTATIELDEGFAFRAKVGAHYSTDLSNFDGPDDLRYIVTLQPTRINAQ